MHIQKERHLTSLFVSSLIFLIFFAIRTVLGVTSISDWVEIKNLDLPSDLSRIAASLHNIAMIGIILAVASFAVILIFFILTCILKKQDTPIAKRINLSRILFVFAVLAMITGALYAVSEVLIYMEGMKFIKEAYGASGISGEELLQLQKEFRANFFGAIAFDIIYVFFTVANISKSQSLTRDLKNQVNIS